MLTETSSYDDLTRDFRWDIPARFNIATACCDRHADGTNKLALIYVDEDGRAARTSFDELRALSCRFANVLRDDGLVRGDRVAAFLSQSLELPVVHLAAFRSGLVSVPLFTLFGEDALEFRLANSGASAVVTDQSRKLVMTVSADGTVVPKPVEVGPINGGLREISSGLAPTDRVIINGLQRVRPGALVSATKVVMDMSRDGLRQVAAVDPDGAAGKAAPAHGRDVTARLSH